MDAGDAIRTARARAGLTQTQLARLAATSQTAISAYESGRKQPSLQTLTRILAAAGARLALEAAETAPARIPPRGRLAQNGRRLVEVLALAEALPSRHDPDLRFPRLQPHST